MGAMCAVAREAGLKVHVDGTLAICEVTCMQALYRLRICGRGNRECLFLPQIFYEDTLGPRDVVGQGAWTRPNP